VGLKGGICDEKTRLQKGEKEKEGESLSEHWAPPLRIPMRKNGAFLA